MAVFRVEHSRNYTVMSNYHLRDKNLSLKAKGLLSQILSLPEDWNYTLTGLSKINAEGRDAVRTALVELERAGYISRRQTVDQNGRFGANEYIIRERPASVQPPLAQPSPENPAADFPAAENPTQLNKDSRNTEKQNKDTQSKDSLPFSSGPSHGPAAARPPETKGRETYSAVRETENGSHAAVPPPAAHAPPGTARLPLPHSVPAPAPRAPPDYFAYAVKSSRSRYRRMDFTR